MADCAMAALTSCSSSQPSHSGGLARAAKRPRSAEAHASWDGPTTPAILKGRVVVRLTMLHASHRVPRPLPGPRKPANRTQFPAEGDGLPGVGGSVPRSILCTWLDPAASDASRAGSDRTTWGPV